MAEDKPGKKDKVIHTRVSESLDEEIKTRASGLGISVSNLVRNALLNAFGLVEGVIADSESIAESARAKGVAPPAELSGPRPPRSDDQVVGWQRLVLNLNAVCSACNAILSKGSEAAVGVTGAGFDPRSVICLKCLERSVRDDDGDDEPTPSDGS